jgi:hypothetical protein
MQPARIRTAWQGLLEGTRSREIAGAGVVALLCLLILGAATAISAWPQEPVWDQAQLLKASFAAPFHPSPPMGFTAQLCVIAIKVLAPGESALNEAVRIFAMAFWAGASCFLALALLERRASVVALLLVLFTSQFPFLWLSTELMVGGFLCLVLGAWMRGWHPAAVGSLLALLGLCKPDLALVAGVLAVCFGMERPTTRRPLALGLVLTGALLVAPGLVFFGPGYLTDYGPGAGGRGFAAFGQHFAALVAPFQVGPAPDPWAQPGPYLAKAFPGARSLQDVVTAPGLPYLDHVALAISRGLRKVGWLFQWAWLAVPLLWFARRHAGLSSDSRERVLLWSFVGCVPFVLLAYPHIRYFARYYPIFWLLLLVSLERLSRVEEAAWRRPAFVLAGLCLLLAFAVSVDRASIGLALAPKLPMYWFPD